MPNLRGASLVGRDGGSSSYVARTDSRRTELTTQRSQRRPARVGRGLNSPESRAGRAREKGWGPLERAACAQALAEGGVRS